MKHLRFIFLSVLLSQPILLFSQDNFIKLKGQVDVYAGINFSHPVQVQTGGRFLPTLSAGAKIAGNLKFDTEISVDSYTNYHFTDWTNDRSDASLKMYRLWVRLYSDRFELRAGLQKINFGSASSFRPLMWFDHLDPRDPLQLTTGVYGVLGRYYFQNNANLWLWGLIGNNSPRGWEITTTSKKIPEFGGRIQLPVPKGELAFTYHHRTTDQNIFTNPGTIIKNHIPEDRLGIDGKWDLGIGLWSEYSLTHCDYDPAIFGPWTKLFTLGADYTFAVGNGIYASTEFFRYSNAFRVLDKGKEMTFSSLTANYPFGINRIGAMVYYNWTNSSWYRFINIQRQNDKWTYYMFLYWNPDKFELYNNLSGNSMFAGKGMQLMVVFNF